MCRIDEYISFILFNFFECGPPTYKGSPDKAEDEVSCEVLTLISRVFGKVAWGKTFYWMDLRV